jgi:uncharacterized protein YdaT
MSNMFKRAALLLALAAVIAACGKKEEQATTAAAPAPAPVIATTTPDAAVMATVRALRANDVNSLLVAALPPGEVAKMKADWTKNLNKEPITDEDRKKFSDQMTKLTAPGAEDKLYAEAEPQLKKFDQQSAAQMPMMIAMGQGFVQSAIQQSKEMSDAQKTQAAALVDAAAKWAQSAKFTDPTLVKGAIAVVCKTARDLNLKSLDEARSLSYDQGMIKAGIALSGVKQVLAIYGLEIDRSLDSIKAETVSTTGDAAKVKYSYTAFDQPFSGESELVRVDGKWYGKHAIEEWQKHEAEAAATAANPAVAPTPAPTTK